MTCLGCRNDKPFEKYVRKKGRKMDDGLELNQDVKPSDPFFFVSCEVGIF